MILGEKRREGLTPCFLLLLYVWPLFTTTTITSNKSWFISFKNKIMTTVFWDSGRWVVKWQWASTPVIWNAKARNKGLVAAARRRSTKTGFTKLSGPLGWGLASPTRGGENGYSFSLSLLCIFGGPAGDKKVTTFFQGCCCHPKTETEPVQNDFEFFFS